MPLSSTNNPLLRCGWVHADPMEVAYHDTEWGVLVHDDAKHFEFIILDGFQAGLSWLTILRKRENFRTAFDGFDPAIILVHCFALAEPRLNVMYPATNGTKLRLVGRAHP